MVTKEEIVQFVQAIWAVINKNQQDNVFKLKGLTEKLEGLTVDKTVNIELLK